MTEEPDNTDGTDKDVDHALPDEELNYPTYTFEEGSIDADGSLSLRTDLDREAMGAWAEDLAAALASHDLGVETPNGVTTFGIAPEALEITFDADEDNRGDLTISFHLSAKSMFIDDGSGDPVGARGGAGFVPVSMLTDERDLYRCYSWIDDPEDPA